MLASFDERRKSSTKEEKSSANDPIKREGEC